MKTRNRNAAARIQRSAFSIQHFLFLLLASLLIFSHSVTGALDHDEHQFVASAALLARRGLLPYCDYPYLHTPYAVFADAALFRWAGPSARLLLTARLFSAACGLATVALLAAVVASLYRDRIPNARRWAAPAAVLLLVTNPLFAAVTGLAWNHDAAEMLLLAGTLLYLRDIRRGSYPARSMLATGALLGLSIGVRLTVAPAAAAFAGWALADARVPWRRRLAAAGVLLAGMAVALLPCGCLFLQSPRGFLFGNFGYPTLNTAYRMAHESMTSSITPAGKITYFFSRVVFSSGTGFLVLLVALTVWLRRASGTGSNEGWDCPLRPSESDPTASSRHPIRRLRAGSERSEGSPKSGTVEILRCAQDDKHLRACASPGVPREGGKPGETTFLGVLILFLLVGSFAPAPMFIVYFYAPVPFAVLWLAYAWRPLLSADFLPPNRTRGLSVGKGAAMVLAFCCLACGIPEYRHLATVFRPSRWVPVEVHASGVTLRRRLTATGAPPGAVLTLAPIIPLEGGLDIYEQFATGPFAFRAAPMVPAADRPALHLVDEFDLSRLLKRRPPMAVLYNVEDQQEEAPMLGAVPGACWMVRLVHGSRFVLDRNTGAGKR